MTKTPRLAALVLLLLAGGSLRATEPTVLPSPLEPAGTGGLAALDRALAKLSTHRRLLVVGAHPDDEDTTALALVAREMGGEAAYLALSRGEGGQNLIGSELGEALGVLRTQELLAARRVDGARQYFTRAFDFGYTRSLDETWTLWPREALLEDAIRVVRRFKPQVILSVFGDDGSGGHGQHQAAGHTAYAAFRASAEPRPSLDAENLPPWKASVLYRAAWFAPERATLTAPLGGVDPWSGRSIFQIAMQSRSQHRSQDMGRLLDPGPRDGRFTWVEGEAGRDGDDLFAGLDTHLAAIAASIPEVGLREEIAARLGRVENAARELSATLGPATLASAAARLGDAVGELAAAVASCRASRGCAASPALGLLEEKKRVGEGALVLAAGVVVDVASDRELLVPDEGLVVKASIWNSGAQPVGVAGLELVGPLEPPRPEAAGAAGEGLGPVASGELRQLERHGTVLRGAAPSRPYFLARPRQGALYDWSDALAEERGEPFGAAVLRARVALEIAGRRLVVERPVVFRYADQATGEVRRPLRVVPPVEVAIDRELALVSPERPEAPVEVHLRSHAATPLTGELAAESACPGAAPERRPFTLPAAGEASFGFALRGCGGGPARQPVRFVARLAGHREVDLAMPLVDYPHIAPTPVPKPARVEVVASDLRWPRLAHVGYVVGASDRVPGFLVEAGVPLELLSAETLATGDLARYDAIVVGSRAYETDPALVAHNARLLDYARAGGLVIVQYQQYPFIEGKFAPYPLEIARPHDRVTDESSPVRVLAPEDPIFTWPNGISDADWEGWVQERALYMPRTWDPAYRALLELQDPGETPQRGALLVAKLGRGTYVYSGLAFFRELPAGVPGAYRLFANLLALATPEGHVAADRAALAEELAQRLLVVDTHIDLPYRLHDKKEDPTTRTGGDFDLPRARSGGLDVAFLSIYIPASYQKSGGAKALADELIDGVEALVRASPQSWALAPSAASVAENRRTGRISFALGMENGAAIEDDLANVAHFHDRGIRYITLTHGEDNQICDSSYSKPESRTWHGLSPFGREVVAEMNRLGILVDLSHVSDEAFDQALALTVAPPIASHSSCRFFTPGFERNLDDERIRALSSKGGVIQINFGSSFLTAAANAYSDTFWSARAAFVEQGNFDEHAPEVEAWEKAYEKEHPLPRATLEDVVAHIEHVVELVGVDHVGLGSDFDGVGDSLPTGLQDVSMYPNLFAKLLARGWSEENLAKLAGGNLMRVWREAEEVAKRLQGKG